MNDEDRGFWVVNEYPSGSRISTHSTRLEAVCSAFELVHRPDISVSFAVYSEWEVMTSAADAPNVEIRYQDMRSDTGDEA